MKKYYRCNCWSLDTKLIELPNDRNTFNIEDFKCWNEIAINPEQNPIEYSFSCNSCWFEWTFYKYF